MKRDPDRPAGRGSRSTRCQVCRHEERWRIELLKAGGASLDSLATKFGVHRDAIWRHWQDHVTDEAKAGYLAGPAQLQQLSAKAAESGASVMDHLLVVRTAMLGALATMTEAGDARGCAYVGSKLVGTLGEIAKLSGELGAMAAGTINITNNFTEHPDFLKLQVRILHALAPFPSARAAVVAALLQDERPPAKVLEHDP